MLPRALWHYLAALYLAIQSLLALGWWLILVCEPRARLWFRPSHVPDVALLSFFLPDAILFMGAGLWAAFRFVKTPQRARAPFLLHLGASLYAALYCLCQTLLTGEATLAAILMSAAALCGAFVGWKALPCD